jgi:predicted nucleic acid-binding protein
MTEKLCELVVPDSGPLITLAYAGRLDLLLAIHIKIVIIDMVKLELTRNKTETSELILDFISKNNIEIKTTEIGSKALKEGDAFKKAHAGERALQDFLFEFYDENLEAADGQKVALLLFEDHKIAGTAFVLPDNVYTISTKAFLNRLETLKVIDSAQEVVNAAFLAGRNFSQREVDVPPPSHPGMRPF